MTRRPLAVLAAALSLAALFAAEPSRAAVPGSLSPAFCATATAEASLPWLATPATTCPSTRCTSVTECVCPSASTRSCVEHACIYTYPGGGGSNPHGCHAQKCSTSADCPCSDGTLAACVEHVCTF